MRVIMVRSFAVFLTVLSIAGGVGAASAGAAQDAPGVTGLTSYESPTFGYEVDWAGAMGLWEVVPEATAVDDGLDVLTLVSPFYARVQIFGVDPGLDPDQVLASLVEGTLGNDPGAEIVEDVGGRAPSATVEFEVDGVPTRSHIEARVLESGAALVAISVTTPADLFETNLMVAQEDFDLDGEPLYAGLASESGDGPDRDDDPDRDEDDNRDRDEDEEDDRSSRRSSDETYESPSYGYTLSYDADEWSLDGQFEGDRDNPRDGAFFSNGPSLVGVIGTPYYDDDELADCVADRLDAVEGIDGVSDLDPLDDRGAEGEDDDRAWATYTYVFTDEDGEESDEVRYLECRWLGGGVTVVIDHIAPEDEYEDEVEAREDLLDGLAPSPEEGLG